MVSPARFLLALLACLAGALGAAPAAPADVPGKVRIAVTCGGETLEASSGLGGFAAWTARRDGRRVVLLPVAVTGTVTNAQGTFLRTFDQALGRHEPDPTTTCTFEFAMNGADDEVLTITGQGRFVVRPA